MTTPEKFESVFGRKPICTESIVARFTPAAGETPLRKVPPQFATRAPYKTTESHDRLQAKFGVLHTFDLGRLLNTCGVSVPRLPPLMSHNFSIVLEKPVVCDRYSRANDWRMDAVIEASGLHVIVEVKTVIDSMGELLGQCQRYMRHYRPDYLADGEFCPVIVACPVIEDYLIEVIDAQGFHWLANERWNEFFGLAS